MSGRQVYISTRHHKKLKVASTLSDRQMGEIVESFIEEMEVPGWEDMDDKVITEKR